ncbi:hypothetical protein ILYODFUR_003445 [Ilyodon furcidens]|uniref:Uncharacterized protein n=1 Tax=Ilyodon furcidens TaxID=33524 RepID=A0ABV0STX3_9TELE
MASSDSRVLRNDLESSSVGSIITGAAYLLLYNLEKVLKCLGFFSVCAFITAKFYEFYLDCFVIDQDKLVHKLLPIRDGLNAEDKFEGSGGLVVRAGALSSGGKTRGWVRIPQVATLGP